MCWKIQSDTEKYLSAIKNHLTPWFQADLRSMKLDPDKALGQSWVEGMELSRQKRWDPAFVCQTLQNAKMVG